MKMDEKRLYTDVHFSFILNIKVYVCQHKKSLFSSFAVSIIDEKGEKLQPLTTFTQKKI